MRDVIVVASMVCLAGCLAAPDPSGNPFDTTNNEADGGNAPNNVNNENNQNNENNAPADMGSADQSVPPRDSGDGDPDCAVCTIAALQCATGGGGELVLQECMEVDAGCNLWVDVENCVGDQVCTPTLGCHCDGETCVPGEPIDCPAEGAMLCVLINECPRPIDVGRGEACDVVDTEPAGAPSCADAPQMSYCNTCGADRECVPSCANARGWTCGLIPTP